MKATFSRLLMLLLTKIRGKKIDISSQVSIVDVLFHALSKGGLASLRGFFYKILIKKNSGLLFVGNNVRILSPNKLSCGRNFYIGDNSYIDCFSVDGVRVGDAVTLREGAWLQISSNYSNPGEGVVIGSNVYIGPRVVIGAAAQIHIDDRCQIGANVSIIAENHRFDGGAQIYEQGVTRKGIYIGKDCWVGNNVIILDGVNIGNGCVVGAGSVVTKSVPDGSIIVGNPARIIKNRETP